MALADVIAVAAPFAQPASLPSKVFTAVINLVARVAVISLLSGVGSSAMRPGGAADRGHADKVTGVRRAGPAGHAGCVPRPARVTSADAVTSAAWPAASPPAARHAGTWPALAVADDR